MFLCARRPEARALLTSVGPKLAANGRLYAKQGRGQPGRAPCLGGAARRSAAEPRGALGFTRRARTGLLGAGFSPHPTTLFFLRAERPEGEARRYINSIYFSFCLHILLFC
jgi:hypothetical protein